ncbi:MAG: phosphoribosyl-AMP cyclohydrolase [Candidatus Acidiferrales bacterium]|jgi:phosphoribosyl-AMP cyclohydrolase
MELRFDKGGGLLPVIIQDAGTSEVLMLGFMNPDAFEETRRTGEVVFFSRTRNRLWKKGEQSGHALKLREMRIDCDSDAILLRVDALGPGVCHEGYRSCFFRRFEADGTTVIVEERKFDPARVYAQETNP